MLLDTPSKYKAKIDGKIPNKASKAMNIGTAVHAAILEPEKIFEVLDQCGLTGNQLPFLKAIRDRVMNNDNAKALLTAKGKAELSYFWPEQVRINENKSKKIMCKARPDWLVEGEVEIYTTSPSGLKVKEVVKNPVVDLKTSKSAKRHDFMTSIVKFGYDLQAYQTIRGVSKVTGMEHTHFIFIVVENTEPFDMAVYIAGAEVLERGQYLYERNLKRLAYARESDVWPGYYEEECGVSEIGIPEGAHFNQVNQSIKGRL